MLRRRNGKKKKKKEEAVADWIRNGWVLLSSCFLFVCVLCLHCLFLEKIWSVCEREKVNITHSIIQQTHYTRMRNSLESNGANNPHNNKHLESEEGGTKGSTQRSFSKVLRKTTPRIPHSTTWSGFDIDERSSCGNWLMGNKKVRAREGHKTFLFCFFC